MKKLNNYINEALFKEKLKLDKKTQIIDNIDKTYDFYDLIDELKNLKTNFDLPINLNSSNKVSLKSQKCYMINDTNNTNEPMYIYNILTVQNSTNIINYLSILISKSWGINDSSIDMSLVILEDNLNVDKILVNIGIYNNFKEERKKHPFIINDINEFIFNFKNLLNNLYKIYDDVSNIFTNIREFNKLLNQSKVLESV